MNLYRIRGTFVLRSGQVLKAKTRLGIDTREGLDKAVSNVQDLIKDGFKSDKVGYVSIGRTIVRVSDIVSADIRVTPW